MTEEEQKNLFKPFSQADNSTTRKYGGTGLGLYISSQLMRLLGGNIQCQSRKDKGSSFIVEINDTGNKDTPMTYAIEGSGAEKVKMDQFSIPSLVGDILVVEDSKDNQEIISMYIRNTGADVTVVEDGKRAVETALEKTYDLIFMDMQMPIMGGVEAVRWLRQAGNRTTIVMLTANAMKEERDSCLAAGANDFLTKPIDKRKFYQLLERYLAGGRLPTGVGAETKLGGELDNFKTVFVENISGYIDELTKCLLKKDWESLQKIIHNLKGVGGSLGFPEITDKCSHIESQYVQRNFAYVTKLISELITHCRQVRERGREVPAIERVGT
jgi:CheY-like chemotaxis protein